MRSTMTATATATCCAAPPDVIGSTANYIANGLKWRRGEPWLQEVRVPQNFPWDQADLTIKLRARNGRSSA